MKKVKVCKIDGCNNPYYAKGFCSKHYMRWYKYGNPCVVKRIREGSIIFRKNNIIRVVANNTKNVFIFDNTDEIFNKLNGKNFWENDCHYLKYNENNKGLFAHHFAHHLILPKNNGYDVDHINQNKKDNRLSNLRYITRSENNFNRRIRDDNASGITGVYWNKNKKKWMAYIVKNGKQIHLGYYVNKMDAIKIRLDAEEILFPNIKYNKN